MFTSITRTVVPYLVGLIVSAFSFAGVTVSEDLRASLVSFVTFAVGTVYYVAVRFLESKWPKLGVLLGVPKPPVYGDPADAPVGNFVTDTAGTWNADDIGNPTPKGE